MMADILTKEAKDNIDVLDLVRENKFRLFNVEDNVVSHKDGAINIANRREKNKKRSDENDKILKSKQI